LTGGFKAKSGEGITEAERKGPLATIREEGTQKQNFVQGLPGVNYNQFGEPIYGQSTPFTTEDPYRSSGFALPETIGGIQGVAPPTVFYASPEGAIGSRRVEQPYNNPYMYSNLMPRQYADGGAVQHFDNGGEADQNRPGGLGRIVNTVTSALPNSALPTGFNWEEYARANPDLARFGLDTQEEVEKHWLTYGRAEGRAISPAEAEQRAKGKAEQETIEAAARDRVAREKALRRAQGSGLQYANINAGIGALAPEINPNDPTDITYGARNRQTGMTSLQTTYGPMLKKQSDAMAKQTQILETPMPAAVPNPVTGPVTGGTVPGPVTGGTVPGPVTGGTVPGPGAVSGPAPAPAPAAPANIQEDYKNFFASTKPGSYTDFAGGVLYRAPEYQSGRDSEGRPVKQTMAVFYTPDGREYTLTDKTDLNAIAYTIPEIAS
jgi:hypothetical protein